MFHSIHRSLFLLGALLFILASCAQPPSTLVPSFDAGNQPIDPGAPLVDLALNDPGSGNQSDLTLLDLAVPDTAPSVDSAVPDVPVQPSPCASNPASCPCLNGTCTSYDSEDLCQAKHACISGQCVPDESTVPVCTDPNPNDCATVVCHSGFGICVNEDLPDGSPCNDFQGCTQGETCALGQCQGGSPVLCDDGDLCTTDSCDPATGGCLFVAAACDDGDVCTQDQCDASGACTNTPIVCDDGNSCTNDSCVAGVGCMFQPSFGACDDGNPCTINDVCSGNGCQGAPKGCQDSDPCTQDWCEPDTGECMHGPDPACFVTFQQLNTAVLQVKCTPCHQPGQSAGGPVPKFINDYAKTQTTSFQHPSCQSTTNNPSYTLGGCMLYRIQNNHMPPSWNIASTWLWPLFNGNADYMNSYALTPLEVDMFVKWVNSGMPE